MDYCVVCISAEYLITTAEFIVDKNICRQLSFLTNTKKKRPCMFVYKEKEKTRVG